jgi:hypothetical protein
MRTTIKRPKEALRSIRKIEARHRTMGTIRRSPKGPVGRWFFYDPAAFQAQTCNDNGQPKQQVYIGIILMKGCQGGLSVGLMHVCQDEPVTHLFEDEEGECAIAFWRRAALRFGLPLYVERKDGRPILVSQKLGAVDLGPVAMRGPTATLGMRRPRFLAKRRPPLSASHRLTVVQEAK